MRELSRTNGTTANAGRSVETYKTWERSANFHWQRSLGTLPWFRVIHSHSVTPSDRGSARVFLSCGGSGLVRELSFQSLSRACSFSDTVTQWHVRVFHASQSSYLASLRETRNTFFLSFPFCFRESVRVISRGHRLVWHSDIRRSTFDLSICSRPIERDIRAAMRVYNRGTRVHACCCWVTSITRISIYAWFDLACVGWRMIFSQRCHPGIDRLFSGNCSLDFRRYARVI